MTNKQTKSEVKDIDLETIGIKSTMIQQTNSWRVGKKAFDKVYMIFLPFLSEAYLPVYIDHSQRLWDMHKTELRFNFKTTKIGILFAFRYNTH